jgi:cytoskeletal protein RodZ
MPPVTDEDGRPDWHDHPGVIWAAGAAAVALVGLLVFAVLQVSDGSSQPGDMPLPDTSAASTSTSRKTASTSSSYTVPSVQTSEPTGPAVSGPPPEASTEDQSGPTETTTSTTIYNPYGTTTPTNAGHI